MILNALYDYYHRKTAEQDGQLAPHGFEWKEIPFLIELDQEGKFFNLKDTREIKDKKLIAKPYLIPKSEERSGKDAWKKPNLLWDHYGFVLGYTNSNKQEDIEKTQKQHGTFTARINKLAQLFPDDKMLDAIDCFYKNGDLAKVFEHADWKLCSKIMGCNLSFQMIGRTELVCQNSNIKKYAIKDVKANVPIEQHEADKTDSNISKNGTCLITGAYSELARLHTATPVLDSKSNAKIVSFQKDKGFDSYGKQQSYNAPVSKEAVFAYTTALNHLLRFDSPQRLQVGDASTVFWSEKPSELETQIVDIFGEPSKDKPDANIKAVRSLYQAINHGLLSSPEGRQRFHVLGLSPNAARISIRFWETATIAEFAVRIKQHFDDLDIVHGDKQLPHLPLYRLLVSTISSKSKADNIPPNLAGDTLRAILTGLPYPQTLLAAVVRRNRAEREITYPRAALIKACINRNTRFQHSSTTEYLTVSLDINNTNIGYRLGRLFAVLEKIQEEASPGLNSTIRDRYYGAASSTPVSVFSTLLKLKNHHLPKLSKGRSINLDRLSGEIIDGIEDFPAILTLTDQGRFAIGYYHQRQNFFKKHTPPQSGDQP